MRDLEAESGLFKEQKNSIFERARAGRIAALIRSNYSDEEACAEEAWLQREMENHPVTICRPAAHAVVQPLQDNGDGRAHRRRAA